MMLRRAFCSPSVGQNVRTEVRDHVMLIRLNQQNSKVNTLGEQFTTELAAAIKKAQTEPGIAGAVIISDKSDAWIAGADINMLASAGTEERLKQISESAQELFASVERSQRPIVAAINGVALGGGLETALACHYRIASASPKTSLAVPEVMLGILPGAGGTQRLPKLVGIQEGLGMAMTGKTLTADKAKRIGLVDLVVDPYALQDAAIRACKDIAAGRVKRSGPKPKKLLNRILEDTKVGQDFVFDQARKQAIKASGGHYPAPLAIIDCIKAGVQQGSTAGYRTEREEFAKLGMTSVSKALISVFHAQTACKKNRFGKPAHPINKIACVGAGLMGSGIANVSITKGYRTILKDVTPAAVARGELNCYSIIDKKVKRKSMSAFARDTTFSNLIPLSDKDPNWREHFKNVDMVIEAVFESLELKQNILRQLEEVLPEHAIFATNTSALPIAKIAAASKRPDKVVGMHYFSPVEKMPLLEVVTHDGTSKETTAAAVEVGLKQGKTVIVVKDGPGFYTTRILSPFMAEAAGLLLEGVSVQRLDGALKKFGFPVGPVTLLDEVGIDVGHHISKDLIKVFGDRMGGADPQLMGDMVSAGFLGRKSGAGIFLYPKDAKASKSIVDVATKTIIGLVNRVRGIKTSSKEINPGALDILRRYSKTEISKDGKAVENKGISDADIVNRVLMRMVNEAVLCLQEGILANPTDGDVGAVFGLGFPPFLGGPFRYIDALGAAAVVKIMEDIAARYPSAAQGGRFAPAPLLLEYAKSGKKFHA